MILRVDTLDGADARDATGSDDGTRLRGILADYTSLTDVALRRRLETERGLYMAESSKVIARAIAAGHAPRSFLMAERWYDELRPVIAAAAGTDGRDDGGDVPVLLAPEDVLAALTGFHLHRGALAAMNRPVLPAPAELLGMPGRSRVAVFDGLVDHTNLGAGFRSAAALGVDAVLITPTCADPLYRRAIRVSMGTVFQVPWTRLDSWPAGVDLLHEAGYTVAGLTLDEDSIALTRLVEEDHERLALVLGTEGDGLSARVTRRLDRKVIIPMAHGVDSLNVAASAAVAFWAVSGTRRAEEPGAAS